MDFTDQIPFSDLKLSKRTLGSGSFGTVYKGLWKGRTVAVKEYRTPEEIGSFSVEFKQLSHVKHPNIVTSYGASQSIGKVYLVMEYAECGSLNYLLHECKQQEYDLRHACGWAMQTARAVAYLHGIRPKPIMHRDLKPANLLLTDRGKVLKICDFGTACTVKTQMTNNTGSASYMAPEVFATSSYLESGDVYSWSIIFWEILVREQPYSHQYSNPYQILWCVKQEGIRPTEIENCPKPIWDLITRSWNKDPLRRPTMQQVAEEMEFIFSLTERTTTTPNSPNKPNNRSCNLRFCGNSKADKNLNQQQRQQLQPSLPERITSPLSAHSDSRTSTFAKIRQNRHREHHYRQQHHQLLPSPNSSQTLTTIKALAHKVSVLRTKAEHLEAELNCDKKNNDDSFNEYEELRQLIELAKSKIRGHGSNNCRFHVVHYEAPNAHQHQNHLHHQQQQQHQIQHEEKSTD